MCYDREGNYIECYSSEFCTAEPPRADPYEDYIPDDPEPVDSCTDGATDEDHNRCIDHFGACPWCGDMSKIGD
jgi:hypothetical protein